MLNPSRIGDSVEKIAHKVKKRYITLSLATLMALGSFIPRDASAVNRETLIEFRDLSKSAVALIDSSKTVNTDSSVSYNIPEKSKKEIDKKFKDLVRQIIKETRKEIKNQEWDRAKEHITFIYDVLRTLGYDDLAAEVWKLIDEINKDFTSHIDFRRPGVYTIKGSGKVYIISYGSSPIESVARDIAQSDVNIFLMNSLGVRNAKNVSISGVLPRTYWIEGNKVFALFVFAGSGRVILDDKTVLTESEIAKRLESQGKLLPFK